MALFSSYYYKMKTLFPFVYALLVLLMLPISLHTSSLF